MICKNNKDYKMDIQEYLQDKTGSLLEFITIKKKKSRKRKKMLVLLGLSRVSLIVLSPEMSEISL